MITYQRSLCLYAALLFFCIKPDTHDHIDISSGHYVEIAHAKKPQINEPVNKKKSWTFIVYIAADNDLRNFAARNIKQMAQVGSNENINIVVHLDIRMNGNQKITRRYYIELDKIYHVNNNDPLSQRMDSGDPQTLISCCTWAINNYPADNYALILWNHGMGCIDPDLGRLVNPAQLYTLNTLTNKLELDRSIGFLDFVKEQAKQEAPRGICWDDTTGNYLTNEKLNYALKERCTKVLHGKKLSILGFDACLMAMVEVANIAKNYAHIMVGSQELELGAGFDYTKILQPFTKQSLTPTHFASHIVKMYYETYFKITNDFTQSAIALDSFTELEKNIDIIATLLLDCLKKQNNNSVKSAIQASRNKLVCTHFDEPSYIDLHHFYVNLLANLKQFSLTNAQDDMALKQALSKALEEGKALIKKTVFANQVGKNLSLAQGISIYFPEKRIHSSYHNTQFALHNSWFTFISQYIAL